jgi:hypothetical protein
VTPPAPGPLRRLRASAAARPGPVAIAWAAATFLALAALAGGPGISRDEAAVLEPAARAEGAAAAPRPPAPLASRAAAATRAVLTPAGLSHLRAARLATALFGALLSAALVLLAWELAGGPVALLAPALFWAAPRHLHAGLVATPDVALAALVTGTVVLYRRASLDPDRRRRLRAAAGAGLLFGGALAARTDAWILLAALAAHAALGRALGAAVPAPEGAERRLRGVPAALALMVALGPLVPLALAPWFLGEAARAFAPGAPTPPVRAALVTALTVPATILLACAGGVVHSGARLVRVLRRRAPAPVGVDEALLLLCAAAPFAAAATGVAPATDGVRPWLHAMPFLALLGARALVAAAREAWPERASPLGASLALVVLWPGVRAAAHFHPAGASGWNELAGGAPGAATLALPRQDGGEAAAAVLDALNARARPGARVFWPGIAPGALAVYARDGRLRPDLAVAGTPEEADLAVVPLDGGSRDAEYRVWSAFRTSRPATGAYLDEVPLALVYARSGAWR